MIFGTLACELLNLIFFIVVNVLFLIKSASLCFSISM